ncbi:MAG: hypothetical protein ACFCVE_11090 [Phycisphaerae bacterium]
MQNTRSNNLTVGLLGALAVVLVALHFVLPVEPAFAIDSNGNREYQLITAGTARGNDALYVIDNTRGLMAVFTWDQQQRAVVPRKVQSMDSFFQ